jgi:hypothetical protein
VHDIHDETYELIINKKNKLYKVLLKNKFKKSTNNGLMLFIILIKNKVLELIYAV